MKRSLIVGPIGQGLSDQWVMFQAGSTEPYRTQGLDLIGESGNIVRRTFVEEENGKEIYKIVSELKYKKLRH